MNDLIEWLRAQLDAREKWLQSLQKWPVSGQVFLAYEDEEGVHDHGTFDLGVELREVEAKRAILKTHGDGGESQGFTDTGYGSFEHACTTCGEFGEYGVPWPCHTVRLLALPFADREGYLDEWRP